MVKLCPELGHELVASADAFSELDDLDHQAAQLGVDASLRHVGDESERGDAGPVFFDPDVELALYQLALHRVPRLPSLRRPSAVFLVGGLKPLDLPREPGYLGLGRGRGRALCPALLARLVAALPLPLWA